MAVFRCEEYPKLKVGLPGGKFAEFKGGMFSTTDDEIIELLSTRPHIQRMASPLASEPIKKTKAAEPEKKPAKKGLQDLVKEALKKDVLHLRGEKVFFKSKKVGDDVASAAERLEEDEAMRSEIEAELE